MKKALFLILILLTSPYSLQVTYQTIKGMVKEDLYFLFEINPHASLDFEIKLKSDQKVKFIGRGIETLPWSI